MSYEQKNGQGIIFKNTHKKTEAHPDYTGHMTGLDGKKYSVALWVKEGAKGKFFSMAQSEYKERQGSNESGSNDDLPF